MKRISFVAALCTLILICGLQAAAQNHVIINATGFSYIAGMPDYTQGKGLVAGGSATPVDGFANLAVPQGAVITGFRMCARDFASDQNVSADLWRKTVNPINSAFTAPQRMAHVQTSVAGAQDAMQCLKTNIITGPTVDDTQWTYFVEVHIGFTTELISVNVNY